MSIALIVTGGFGNGTLSGTIKDVVLRGYAVGDAVIIITPASRTLIVQAESRTLIVQAESRTLIVESKL